LKFNSAGRSRTDFYWTGETIYSGKQFRLDCTYGGCWFDCTPAGGFTMDLNKKERKTD